MKPALCLHVPVKFQLPSISLQTYIIHICLQKTTVIQYGSLKEALNSDALSLRKSSTQQHRRCIITILSSLWSRKLWLHFFSRWLTFIQLVLSCWNLCVCVCSTDNHRKKKSDNNTYSLPQFPLFPLLHSGEVVDRRVLYHWQEDKDKTDPEVNVHCLDVRDPGHGGVDPSDDGGHSQHCGDACSKTQTVTLNWRGLDT